MANSRMDFVHEIAAALRLKANAEIIKCTDNGLNTTVRLRTDDKLIDVKVEVYDLEKENDRTPGGTDETVERIVHYEYNTV